MPGVTVFMYEYIDPPRTSISGLLFSMNIFRDDVG
jgi:hypothetical protein